jgi:trk system potassium uptake protein TrkH
MLRFFSKRLTPYQLLLLGYVLVTVSGAVLLSLPVSSARGTHQPLLDALFVATSGISTTGLTVVDVGSYYSIFGQMVLLVIFQIGGVGYMTFIIAMVHILKMNVSFKTGIVARESLSGSSLAQLRRFFVTVTGYTLFFEGVGAVILSVYWMREYPVWRSIYLGVFHSVSAFCTAGFSVFPDSLMKYRQGTLVNLTIIVVSLAGGLGFFVLRDLTMCAVKKLKNERPVRLTLQTKLVLGMTALIIAAATLAVLALEDWPAGMGGCDRAMSSLFQTVSASTTDGFNTIDIGKMGMSSLTVLIFLMFVGASPGSTGGGIKTTTLAVLLVAAWSTLRNGKPNVLKREIPGGAIRNAVAVALCFAVVAFVDLVIMARTEKASYLQVLFEVVSALGNTGLSTGITFDLSGIGKAVLTVTMFIGRVGPLIIAFSLLPGRRQANFEYPREEVLVG